MTARSSSDGRHCDAWNARRRTIAKLATLASGVCIAPVWWFALERRSLGVAGTWVGLAIVCFGTALFFARREVCPACRRSRGARPTDPPATTDLL